MVRALALLLFVLSLPLHPAAAAPLRVRALPIPNIDPQLVDSRGLLVGYDSDNNLVAVTVGRTDKNVLLADAQYHIQLLQISDGGEVFYSVYDDLGGQSVRAVSLDKKHTVREVLSRGETWPAVLVNRRGDVAVRESATSESEPDLLAIHTRTRGTIRIKLPDNYYPLYLGDDGIAYGVYSSWNDARGASERRIISHDYSRKKVRTVESGPLNRSIDSIVYASPARTVFGAAGPVDDGDENAPHMIFSLRLPGSSFSLPAALSEGEDLQGLWESRYALLGAWSEDGRVNRLLKPNGSAAALSCTGLSAVSLQFSGSFAQRNVTLAELTAIDALNQYRDEMVVLVPSDSSIPKVNGEWRCVLR